VVLGKVLFFSYAVVIPLLVHPWWVVFAGYLATSVVLSLSLALTFQAAHCVPLANAFDPHEPVEWAVHQARTSVDFAPGHPLWTWYLGGLNYQLEHHLFPRVCHVHYAALAPIVREVCLAHQVPYRVTASRRKAALLRRSPGRCAAAVTSRRGRPGFHCDLGPEHSGRWVDAHSVAQRRGGDDCGAASDGAAGGAHHVSVDARASKHNTFEPEGSNASVQLKSFSSAHLHIERLAVVANPVGRRRPVPLLQASNRNRLS